MELKMNDYLLPEKILFNYEELKQELVEKIAHYETLVYTDEQIKDAKADKATLNKLKKALNEERIRVKNEYLKPFEDFEKKINEIISIIDEPVTAIDKQIKQYEEKNRQEKLEKVKELWQSLDAPEGLTFEKVFQEKFLNVSCSTKRVSQYMIDAIDKFNRDIETLEQLPAFSFEAQQVYKETCDINKALLEGQKLLKIQKEKEDYQKKTQRETKEVNTSPRTIEVASASEETSTETETDGKMWVSFSALLSTEEALALRDFFKGRNIEFGHVLNGRELYLISKVFQQYYHAGIDEIKEEDEDVKTVFEKLGM